MIMPELPEVETTCRALKPLVCGKTITHYTQRQPKLRWPIPANLERCLLDAVFVAVQRRGKYLLFTFNKRPERLLVHLGMSGSLRVTDASSPWRKHDHVIISLDDGMELRLHDPRRFGAVLLDTPQAPHRLLQTLGAEPLTDAFSGEYLAKQCHKRKVAIKSAIMNGQIVVGVGNIYACEALFLAGIHPQTPAGKLTDTQYAQLVDAIKTVLAKAIKQGGTTLRDFVNPAGDPGYFKQTLNVYDRAAQPCKQCGTAIESRMLNQRNTYFCPNCQR